MSKFMLLIVSDREAWAGLTEEEGQAVSGEYGAFTQALLEAGVLVDGNALQGPETSRTVRGDGVASDGPFAEVTEHLGGYYVIETPSIEEASAWAAKAPSVVRRLGAVEVRPVQEMAS